MATHGYNPIQSDQSLSLPAGDTEYSADMTYVGASNGKQRLLMIAQNAVEVAAAKAISVEFVYATTADPTTNKKTANHIYLLHKTSADDELAYAAGAIMIDFVLPEGLMAAGDHFRLKIVTDADESADDVDVLLVSWGD